MTVTTDHSRISYVGDGTSVTFAFPDYFLAATDIRVFINFVEVTTGFTVSGAGSQSGGSVAFNTPPVAGAKILLVRDPDRLQQTALPPNDPFPSVAVERALDKLTMIAQGLKVDEARTVRFPLSESTDGQLPLASQRASMVYGFDATGTPTFLPMPSSLGAGDLRWEKGIGGTRGFKPGVDFTPDVTASLPLSRIPVSDGNCWVYWDGVPQLDFSLAGNVLSFPVAIPSGISVVNVRIGTTLSLNIPASNSVDDDKLQWGLGLTRTVSSVAEMAALDATRFKRVMATGARSTADGGGGDYYYDAAASQVGADGFIKVPSTTGTGCWRLMIGRWVSVMQAGAKGDGVADDTVAFKAARDTGKNVYVPDPSVGYLITSNITISLAQRFSGDGLGKSKILAGNFDLFTLTTSYCGVEDLTISSTAQRTAGKSVNLTGVILQNFVRRVRIENHFTGVAITGSGLSGAVETYIQDCQFQSANPVTGRHIQIAGGNDTYIIGCIGDNAPAAQPFASVEIQSSQATWIQYSDFIHGGYGLVVDPDGSLGQAVTYCFFSNNAFDTNANEGFLTNPVNSGVIRGLFFEQCWFATSLRGVNISSDNGLETPSVVDTVTFNNCKIVNNQREGALVQTGSNIEFNNSTGNGNSVLTPNVFPGIQFANGLQNFAVRDSHIGSGMGFANQMGYGIFIGTGCNNYQITNNNLFGNAIANLRDDSAGSSSVRVVKGNLGAKTTASGVGQIASGATAGPVTHGLMATPRTVQVTPLNANLAGASYWAGTLGATTFALNLSVAQGVLTNYSWSAEVYD